VGSQVCRSHELPGNRLITLRDAAEFTKLPKAEHDAEARQAAMQTLLLVAEQDGSAMFARIGVMKVLNRRRAGVQPVAERHALGTAQAEERPMTTRNRLSGGVVTRLRSNALTASCIVVIAECLYAPPPGNSAGPARPSSRLLARRAASG
jgi:hypothetical protein